MSKGKAESTAAERAPEKGSLPTTHPPLATPVGHDWARMRLWQIQPLRDILVLLLVFGVLWLGYRLSIVTVPLLLAILLAYLVEPLVERLTRTGRISRHGAAGGFLFLTLVVVVIPVVLGITFGAVQATNYLARQAQNVGLTLSSIDAPADQALARQLRMRGKFWSGIRDSIVEQETRLQLQEARRTKSAEPPIPAIDTAPVVVPPSVPTPMTEPPPTAGEFRPPAETYMMLRTALQRARVNAEGIAKQALESGAGFASGAARIVTGTAGTIGQTAFAFFLTGFFFFFICTGWGRVLAFWKSLIPERKKHTAIDLAMKMDVVIAGFVRGRLTICAILMVYYTIGYAVIGVPAWLVMGPLVGALALVPYAQSLAAPVAMLLMLLDPSGDWRDNWWWVVGSPLGLLGIAQLLDDYVLTPRIQGKTTNMDTPTILFASIAGGALAGIYGLLVAIPVAACIKIVLREVFWPRFRKWAQGKEPDFLPIKG